MSELILSILAVKQKAMKMIVDYPATYHALDVAESIAGWEEASKRSEFDLAKKVRQIYSEALRPTDSYKAKTKQPQKKS